MKHLEAAVRAEVDLGVDERPVFLQPLEGVSRVPVLLVVTIGRAAVGEEDHDLVNRLRVLREVVL